MLLRLNSSVQDAIEEVLRFYDYVPAAGFEVRLHRGSGPKGKHLHGAWKLWEAGLRPGDHVWLEVL